MQLWAAAELDGVGDAALVSALGVTRVRVPVLWQRVAPDGLFCPDWRDVDVRLDRLRALRLEPVVTLVQSGAVPAVDGRFAATLAELAVAVVERYPWVKCFTPVHAPVSLALERAGEAAQLRALCRFVEGTSLAMQAVRAVSPNARLVQTEDLRTSKLDVDDELGWLGLDLLTGRFERNAALQAARVRGSIAASQLEPFEELAYPPDVLLLDWALERDARRAGPLGALLHASRRYELPLALGGAPPPSFPARDEQLRWLDECVSAVREVGGIALTLSQVFGPHGAYDVRGEHPRKTALAHALGERRPAARSPALEAPCRWKRGQHSTRRRRSRPVLITGAPGSLARALAAACQERSLAWVATPRDELDVTDFAGIGQALERYEPWAVVNAAGFTRVDAAEVAPGRCHRENAMAPALLAMQCARVEVPLVTFSSDLVFDGDGGHSHVEGDAVDARSVYARTKVAGEQHVLRLHAGALVVRAGPLFGGPGERDFAARVSAALERGETFEAASDHLVSPAYAPDLTNAVLDLLFDRASGLWHLTNRGQLTVEELARALASRAGLAAGRVVGVPSARLHVARRPRSSVLASSRGDVLPSLSSALTRFSESWRERPLVVYSRRAA
ncbi:MAG: sugar nucleotide-binding protein [Myxococcaceae bacterium]|nr:sugar nucleotide-binding protein [Myxococcaceae bacterium]